MDRWTCEQANDWWQAHHWVCGCNFLPSSAVNFIEMWHAQTFDPDTIERELGWAADIGFNAIRVNLPFIGWQHDREGLLERFEQLLQIATRHRISTVPCLFDDCGFGGEEPMWGRQPEPLTGIHNSRAVASPGRSSVLDPSLRPALEGYVSDLIGHFRQDKRVLFWDLYNEPGNGMNFGPSGDGLSVPDLKYHAKSLMEQCFGWAREEAPTQPLTVAAWSTPLPGDDTPPYQSDIDRSALLHSDIVTFHAYCSRARADRLITELEKHDRPILCTEWMARAIDDRVAEQMALYQERNVGCFQWGLVKGRTQTWLPWPDDLVQAHGGCVDSSLWFHDLLHEDGKPYDPDELEAIRSLTGMAASTPEQRGTC